MDPMEQSPPPTTPPKRGRGRPKKLPGELRRAAFQSRLRHELRARLEAEAAKNTRSLSEEIEARLEGSFHTIESRFGGVAGLNMATMLFASFNFAGGAEAQKKGHPEWTSAEWLADPYCFERALQTLVISTWEYHPDAASGQNLLAWLQQTYQRVLNRELTKQWHAEREAQAAAAKDDEAAWLATEEEK
jgi:hypothetical protein